MSSVCESGGAGARAAGVRLHERAGARPRARGGGLTPYVGHKTGRSVRERRRRRASGGRQTARTSRGTAAADSLPVSVTTHAAVCTGGTHATLHVDADARRRALRHTHACRARYINLLRAQTWRHAESSHRHAPAPPAPHLLLSEARLSSCSCARDAGGGSVTSTARIQMCALPPRTARAIAVRSTGMTYAHTGVVDVVVGEGTLPLALLPGIFG